MVQDGVNISHCRSCYHLPLNTVNIGSTSTRPTSSCCSFASAFDSAFGTCIKHTAPLWAQADSNVSRWQLARSDETGASTKNRGASPSTDSRSVYTSLTPGTTRLSWLRAQPGTRDQGVQLPTDANLELCAYLRGCECQEECRILSRNELLPGPIDTLREESTRRRYISKLRPPRP